MQMVTVAIADTDPRRRAKLEQSLQEGQGVKVLASAVSNGGEISTGPGLQRRMDTTAIEDLVARVSRLKPRILFVDLSQSADEDFALLATLTRECPETRVILLTDKSVPDEQIIQALANGARGCLNHEADPFYFLKAVRVVDRGEAWVTRRMLSKIMDEVLH